MTPARTTCSPTASGSTASRVPGLAVWKGDQVAACVAAASVLAKVTRDRIMVELHERFPEYEFAAAQGLRHRRTPPR